MNGKFLLLIVLSALIFGACAAPSPPPAPTLAPPTVAPVLPTARPGATAVPPTSAPAATRVPPTATPTPVTLKQMAEKIAANAGKVMKVVEGDPKRVIFVFEELHDSRLGQVEIAIMLNRLYEDYELKHIGLEGYSADQPPLNLTWAHPKPPFRAKQKITAREDVIVYTLREGTISNAEMMGLIYADVVIDGIDDAKLYAFNPPAGAEDAPSDYLYQIALGRMSNVQRTAWQALYDSQKYGDAFAFAMSVDKFTADTWARLSDRINIASAEEALALVDQIKAEAQKAGFKPTAEQQAKLEGMRENLKTMSQRSDALSANILKVAAANPGAPLAMTVGALHTARLDELLTKAGVSFVILRPESLAKGSTAGMLSPEAFARKMQGRSPLPAGYLGAWIDGRKKPEVVADKEWYKLEENVRIVIQELGKEALDALNSGASEEEVKKAVEEGFKKIAENGMLEGEGGKPNIVLPMFGSLDVRVLKISRDANGNPVLQLAIDASKWSWGKHIGVIVTVTNEKRDELLGDTLSKTKNELEQETQPPTEPKPGDPPTPHKNCSNTEVTVATGG